MAAGNVWFGNRAWPSGRSPGDFAGDIFRLEGCRSDKEKALAFYGWMIRCLMRGPNLYLDGGCGTYQRCFDPLTLFAWGSHECTGWGWIAVEALGAAGLKARRIVCHNNGHTFYEVWYAGDNGRESWHAFDPFGGWYVLNDEGEVASCEEIAANSQLVQQPHPGHSVPLGHTWDASHIAHRHMLGDALDIVQRIKGERLAFDLRPGQSCSQLWRPESPERALLLYNDAPPEGRGRSFAGGSHCTIEPYDHEGRARYPQHEPYWRHYRWPSSLKPQVPVRWHGAGSWRWRPLPYGAAAAEWCAHARFENGLLHCAGRNKHTEVWYRIRLPYLASYIHVDTTIEGAGYAGLSISPDDGRTLWNLWSGAPRYFEVHNGQAAYLAGKPSVAGLRDFLLRVDMNTSVPQGRIWLSGLRIMVGYQHNMFVQPRLLPGANPLYLEAGTLDEGERLRARWNFTAPEGEREEEVVLDRPGRAERTVEIACARPDDLVMRGVTLSCE